MKLLCLVLAALICGSTLAAVDCTSFTTQDTCTDTTCKYTETSKTCTTNCATLTKDTCTNGDNANSCEAVPAICKANTDALCSTANTKLEADCTSINAPCKYTPKVDAVCTLKDSVKTTCEAITVKANCSDKCVYTDPVYASCKKAANICATFDATCKTPYCTKTFDTCDSLIVCTDLADDGTMEAKCLASKGCKYTAGTPNTCTLDTDICNATSCDADKCIPSATGTCALNNSDNTCAGKSNETNCASDDMCEQVPTEGSCGAKTDLCTPCNDTDCDITKQAVDSKCEAKDCPGDITACGDKCTATTFACNVKEGAKCNAAATTKDQCTGFCTFASKGTCAANSTDGDDTNGVILAYSSLIAIFAMLF